jgi:hypothetical protein
MRPYGTCARREEEEEKKREEERGKRPPRPRFVLRLRML